MFAYCTQVLHLSEAEAYLRITVARAAREHPLLLTMLADGRLHLSGIVKLLPILTRENRDGLLERATHRSKRQIVELVAELSPRPDAPSFMRKLPQRRPAPVADGPTGSEPGRRAVELGPDGVELPTPTATAGPAAPPLSRSARARPDRSDVALTPGLASAFVPHRRRTTRGRGAAVARPLQGPVHGQRPAPRQARAALGPDACRGARRRPGRDHRGGRHREARADRSQALRQDEGSPQGARGHRYLSELAPHPGRRPACRAGAGRQPLPLRRRARPTMLRARPARVPPSTPVRHGRRPQPSQPSSLCPSHNRYLAEHDYGPGCDQPAIPTVEGGSRHAR